MSLILPKNNAVAETLDATMEVYYEANDWVPNGELIDKLSKMLKQRGIESATKEPQSYTKKTQVPAYFGFMEWEDYTSLTSARRLSESGRAFYEARRDKDENRVLMILLRALQTRTFGRNVIGCSSDSDLEAPNIFVKASLLLNGLSNREFAYILDLMENRQFEIVDAVCAVKMHRVKEHRLVLSKTAEKWADAKPIVALKNWGFLDESGCVNTKLFSHMNELLNLRVKNTDKRILPLLKDDDSDKANEKAYTNHLLPALRYFRAQRALDEWQTCEDGYKDICTGTREYFGKVSEEEIRFLDKNGFADFCKNHTWMGRQGCGWGYLSGVDDIDEYCALFAELMTGDKKPSEYLGVKQLKGIGKAFVSELLMKFHPSDYCLYNKKTHEVLSLLGLIDGNFDDKFSASKYLQILGIQATIRQLMVKEKIKATLDEDSGEPDFLTVNEFLFYVAKHKESIKEAIMADKLKDIKPEMFDDTNAKDFNFKDDPQMLQLVSALRTKPFAILAGHSGTGKSRMVRRLAYMTCSAKDLRKDDNGKELDQPGNFCMIQVKPNWHDNTELLGYYSEMKGGYKPTEFTRFICKAYAYPMVPFFVCLDEMNLAPVEHYFAEYLSAIESAKIEGEDYITDPLIPKDKSLYDHPSDLGAESIQSDDWIKKHGLTIPKNLFVVGTVNMDETTCQFSRKVLDRAMTIEMAKVDFDTFGTKDKKPSFDDTLKCVEIKKLLDRKVDATELSQEQKDNLKALQTVLEKTPFMVAYRFANEYALYEDSLKVFKKDETKNAFDHMVLMKVLPRIAGERSVIEEIFDGNQDGTHKGLLGIVGDNSKSGNKIKEITERTDNYLSFWP